MYELRTTGLLLTLVVTLGLASMPPVKIGFLNPLTNGGGFETYVNASLDSFKVVFDKVNANGGIPYPDGTPSGRMIEIVMLDNKGNTSLGPEVLTDALEGNHSDMMFVHLAFASRFTVPIEPVLAKYNLTVFGPVTGENIYYTSFDPRYFNVVPSADSEALGLLRYLIVRKNLKRIAIIVPYGMTYGQSQRTFVVKLLQQMGQTLVDEFWLDHPTSSFYTELGEFLAAKPQGVLFFGALTTSGANALGVVLQSLPSIEVMVPVATSALLDSVLKALPSSVVNGRIVAGSQFPYHKDTKYTVVGNFLSEVGATAGLHYPLPVVRAFDILGSLVFSAYLHNRLALEVLKRNVNITDRGQFRSIAFTSNILNVDDLFFGAYYGECTGMRTRLCGCNNGAHSVYFNRIEANRSFTPLPDEVVDTPIDTCREENLSIPSPLLQLQVLDTAVFNTSELQVQSSLQQVAAAAAYALTPSALAASAKSVVQTGTTYPVLNQIERSADAETVNPLDAQVTNYLLTLIAGSLTKYGVQNSSFGRQYSANATRLPVTVIDDLSVIPYQVAFEMHTVHIVSTLQQDIHTLAGFAASNSIQMHIVASSHVTDTPQFFAYLSKSAITFGGSVGNTIIASTSSSLGENPVASALRGLSASGVILLLCPELTINGKVGNLNDTTLAISLFLAANPDAYVALPYSSLLSLYPQLATLSNSQRERILLPTNLPRWGSGRLSNSSDVTSSSLLAASSYFTTVSPSSRCPATIWHYFTQQFIKSVVERVAGALSSDSLLSNIYLISSIVVEDTLTVGPLYSRSCRANEIKGVDPCENNIGARLIFVHTLSRAMSNSSLDSSIEPVYSMKFSSGAVLYTTPISTETEASTTVIIVASVCGSALLAMVVTALILFCFCVGRNHSNAPRNDSEPFTIAFTDIQSSTALWAEIPEIMGPSLDLHHRAIRTLIAHYKGYEVKTIGDSFMVAFTSPTKALKFAAALQRTFFKDVKWPGNGAIDTMYIRLDEMKVAALRENPTETLEDDIAKLSINLGRKAYSEAWNGLRVRVGIHCGIGEILKDEVTGGYDYYGSVVNIAARVEAVSHGGQIVITRDTANAIISEGHERLLGMNEGEGNKNDEDSLINVPLGQVRLRGFPEPLELIQLCSFSGRQFPSLRIDHVAANEDVHLETDSFFDGLVKELSSLAESQRSPSLQPSDASDAWGPHVQSESYSTVGKEAVSRTGKLIASGTAFLEALVSALQGSSKDTLIKHLCDTWRIRMLTYEKFSAIHKARIQQIKDKLQNSHQTVEIVSGGSRQQTKIHEFITGHSDTQAAYRQYQLVQLARRIAPVIAAKEDKAKEQPQESGEDWSQHHGSPDNSSFWSSGMNPQHSTRVISPNSVAEIGGGTRAVDVLS